MLKLKSFKHFISLNPINLTQKCFINSLVAIQVRVQCAASREISKPLHNLIRDIFGGSIVISRLKINKIQKKLRNDDEGQSHKEIIENPTKKKGFRDFSNGKVSFFSIVAKQKLCKNRFFLLIAKMRG